MHGPVSRETDPLSDLQTRWVHAIHVCASTLSARSHLGSRSGVDTLRRSPPQLATYLRSTVYLMLTILLIVTGGAVLALYSMHPYLDEALVGKRASARAFSPAIT